MRFRRLSPKYWAAISASHLVLGISFWPYRALVAWLPSMGILWLYEKFNLDIFHNEIGYLEYSIKVDRVSIFLVVPEDIFLLIPAVLALFKHKENR